MKEIQIALMTRLNAMTPALPTVRENQPADTTAAAYQSVFFLPAPPENPVMGGNMYRETGVMQVSLFYPLGVGVGAVLAQAKAIRDWFPRGSSYSNGGVMVIVANTPAIGRGRRDMERYHVPVDIRYFANIILP